MLATPTGGVVPFKSKAQRRKFAELLVEGKIEPETFEEWNRATGKKVLPERIHPLEGSKTGARKTTRARPRRTNRTKKK